VFTERLDTNLFYKEKATSRSEKEKGMHYSSDGPAAPDLINHKSYSCRGSE